MTTTKKKISYFEMILKNAKPNSVTGIVNLIEKYGLEHENDFTDDEYYEIDYASYELMGVYDDDHDEEWNAVRPHSIHERCREILHAAEGIIDNYNNLMHLAYNGKLKFKCGKKLVSDYNSYIMCSCDICKEDEESED